MLNVSYGTNFKIIDFQPKIAKTHDNPFAINSPEAKTLDIVRRGWRWQAKIEDKFISSLIDQILNNQALSESQLSELIGHLVTIINDNHYANPINTRRFLICLQYLKIELNKKLTTLIEKKASLAKAYANGNISLSSYLMIKFRLTKEIISIETEILTLDKNLDRIAKIRGENWIIKELAKRYGLASTPEIRIDSNKGKFVLDPKKLVEYFRRIKVSEANLVIQEADLQNQNLVEIAFKAFLNGVTTIYLPNGLKENERIKQGLQSAERLKIATVFFDKNPDIANTVELKDMQVINIDYQKRGLPLETYFRYLNHKTINPIKYAILFLLSLVPNVGDIANTFIIPINLILNLADFYSFSFTADMRVGEFFLSIYLVSTFLKSFFADNFGKGTSFSYSLKYYSKSLLAFCKVNPKPNLDYPSMIVNMKNFNALGAMVGVFYAGLSVPMFMGLALVMNSYNSGFYSILFGQFFAKSIYGYFSSILADKDQKTRDLNFNRPLIAYFFTATFFYLTNLTLGVDISFILGVLPLFMTASIISSAIGLAIEGFQIKKSKSNDSAYRKISYRLKNFDNSIAEVQKRIVIEIAIFATSSHVNEATLLYFLSRRPEIKTFFEKTLKDNNLIELFEQDFPDSSIVKDAINKIKTLLGIEIQMEASQ